MIFVKNTTLLFLTKMKVVQCALQRIAMGGLGLENQLSVWNVPNTTLPYQNENCAVHLNGRSCISLREVVGSRVEWEETATGILIHYNAAPSAVDATIC